MGTCCKKQVAPENLSPVVVQLLHKVPPLDGRALSYQVDTVAHVLLLDNINYGRSH